MLSFQTPLSEIKGIGPKFLARLDKLKIKTVKDLLWHFPNRYEDFSNILKIRDLALGQHATISGVIQTIKLSKTWKRKMFIVEALVSDETGSIRAVWFNQKFLITMLKKGMRVNLAGKVSENKKGGLVLSHPVHEIISYKKETAGDFHHTARVVPVYPETKGLTSKALRYLIKPLLDKIKSVEDHLPEEILEKFKLFSVSDALYKIHFPEKIEEAREAKKRFAFEDLFFIQLVNLRQKMRLAKEKAYGAEIDSEEVKGLLKKIPFELTLSQKNALTEILEDIKKPHPMNRLLQGDVGSGKTIVAILAALVVAKLFDSAQGKQSAFMAPTEILARQHYQTFKKFFKDFSKGAALITSSAAKIFYGQDLESDYKKQEVVKKISSGEIKIVFGTHSLIQRYLKFKDLALVVIDEQHRFGVRQRAELMRSKTTNTSESTNNIPHLLSMSATPIPRTLTLTVFGDLDLSIIDELPKGRKEIITKIVAPENRDKAYAFIRGQVKKGRQVFVICPRIEPPEELGDIIEGTNEIKKRSWFWDDVKNAKEEYEKLAKKAFPDLKVGLLHGKLKAKEKNETMKKFKDGLIDILVSTSVVEVGVDIPNAVIMLIESAERFGLSQLYQFRGRVGRGEHQSFCLLFTEAPSKTVYKRLNSLIKAKNGFELAEMDLALRGPGEFLGGQQGVSQTGLPDLAMRALRSAQLVKESRAAAETIIKKDPELNDYKLLKERLEGFQKEIHLE
jgi:ATP-dependent DNA helicase RecG